LKFTITKARRGDGVAIWVNIPAPTEGQESLWNIWDVPAAIADNQIVMNALTRAFELGMLAQKNLTTQRLSQYHNICHE